MTHRSTVNRNWALKNLVFFVFLLGLGLWGLYDATIAYPNKGRRHAEWCEWQYLDYALDNGFSTRASVPEPRDRLNELLADEDALAQSAGAGGIEATRAQFDLNQLRWLRSLSLVGLLKPERTVIDDPLARFDALNTEWSQRGQVTGLAGYDLAVQWLIAVLGLGGALWVTILYVKVRSRTYTFDDESMTLTLPSGQTLVPADIEVFDKRKWHRYILFLKIRHAHTSLGGRELRLDLLRHAPLEDWVKRMFREAQPEEYRESFPEEFEAADTKDPNAKGAPNDDPNDHDDEPDRRAPDPKDPAPAPEQDTDGADDERR